MSSDRPAGNGLHVSRTALVKSQRPARPGNGPVRTTQIHPQAWRLALRLADGRLRRIERSADGSVIVHNKEGNYNA